MHMSKDPHANPSFSVIVSRRPRASFRSSFCPYQLINVVQLTHPFLFKRTHAFGHAATYPVITALEIIVFLIFNGRGIEYFSCHIRIPNAEYAAINVVLTTAPGSVISSNSWRAYTRSNDFQHKSCRRSTRCP